MKLRTSFFNFRVLKKDFTRFLPVWGLYTVFLLLAESMLAVNGLDPTALAVTAGTTLLEGMAVVNLLYAALCAMTLFGDLYVPKVCNALHALPMKRSGWFLTHGTAGLLFSLLPNILAALIGMIMLRGYWKVALLWLGVSQLQYLFFYGAALLCVMCAGNKLGMAAMYGILNFFSMLLLGMAELFYEPLLYGVVLNEAPFLLGCPVAQLVTRSLVVFNPRMEIRDQGLPLVDHFIPEAWIYLGILAGLGLVLAVLALLLYRRRQLEKAGDLLAVRWASPVFLLLLTLGTGMLFYVFADLFTNSGSYAFLLAGMAVGFFAGKMLLKRTVKVFSPRTVLSFALLCVLLLGSLYITKLDPAGIAERVPEADEIEACELSGRYSMEQPDGREDIDRIRALHRKLIEAGPQEERNGPQDTIFVNYRLKDGSLMKRKYIIYPDSPAAALLREYLSDWRILLEAEQLGFETLEQAKEHFVVGYADLWDEDKYQIEISRENIGELLDAIRTDCEEGRFAQPEALHPTGSRNGSMELHFHVKSDGAERNAASWFWLYPSCSHTHAVLQRLSQQAEAVS